MNQTEQIAVLERELRSWQITAENKDKEILQLKGELEAVGAGGVQALRASTTTDDDDTTTKEQYRRMFAAACADLGLINEALGLDPNDGGADPILDAIEELRATPAAPVAIPTSDYSRETFRIGGRCDKHICPKPCHQCALTTQPAAVAVGEREAFERFMRIDTSGFSLERNADGSYKEFEVATYWHFWQARAALATTPVEGPTQDEQDRAFEDWLARTCPSGDHESVGRQWEESADYRDLFTPAKAEVQAEPVADSFRDWFAKNYPSDTIIIDPDWHAQSIYRMAMAHARITSRPQATQQEDGNGL